MKKKIKMLLLLIGLLTIQIGLTSALFNSTSSISNTFNTIRYSFSLNSNGGVFKSHSVDITNNGTKLPIPSKSGYSFIGYSDSIGSEIITTEQVNDVSLINNKTIYANWDTNAYRVNYFLNGGSLSNPKYSYNVEEDFYISDPTKEGNTFIGWTGSNGINPQKSLYVPKGTVNDLNYYANWDPYKYTVDVNPIIQNVSYNSGLTGFTFSVWLDGVLVADHVTDYYNSAVPYGTKLRVYVYDRDGYSVKSFRDYTWTVTSYLEIVPIWYDDIPPTITSFSVTNLGYKNGYSDKAGWNVRIYIYGYDNGTGISLYQTWLKPYMNGQGGARKDGNDRTLIGVLYLEQPEGRTFCAYAIDAAGNETEKCETIKV